MKHLSIESYLWTFLLVTAITIIGHFLTPFFDLINIPLLYLLPVLTSAIRWGKGPSFFASILGVLAFDYYFVPPALGFIPSNPRDFFILAIFFLVAVVVGTKTTQLRKETEHLRALASRLQSIREEERTKVAREIHDQLGQTLTGLKMGVSLLLRRMPNIQEALANDLRVMERDVDDTIQLVRKIATELRPGILDDLGLVAAIEWQVEDFKNRTGIESELSSTLEDSDLNQELATALFRILQETLTNIIRHAQATRATITVKMDDDFIVMTVKDNGKGIFERKIHDPGSLGLLGIRERALIFGGEAHISGRRGKGTEVVVKIPFKKADVANA
ncbi:MAG: sensor histidine kinase [Desulfobacteraceae bacterium]|nr:sensor histidine kinase [Desulfobacteraceae bacterium]